MAATHIVSEPYLIRLRAMLSDRFHGPDESGAYTFYPRDPGAPPVALRPVSDLFLSSADPLSVIESVPGCGELPLLADVVRMHGGVVGGGDGCGTYGFWNPPPAHLPEPRSRRRPFGWR